MGAGLPRASTSPEDGVVRVGGASSGGRWKRARRIEGWATRPRRVTPAGGEERRPARANSKPWVGDGSAANKARRRHRDGEDPASTVVVGRLVGAELGKVAATAHKHEAQIRNRICIKTRGIYEINSFEIWI
jgi:hypothetical protein